MKNELDILKAPFKPETVFDSISAVLPSIELVDSRFEDWTVVGVKNLIADIVLFMPTGFTANK